MGAGWRCSVGIYTNGFETKQSSSTDSTNCNQHSGFAHFAVRYLVLETNRDDAAVNTLDMCALKTQTDLAQTYKCDWVKFEEFLRLTFGSGHQRPATSPTSEIRFLILTVQLILTHPEHNRPGLSPGGVCALHTSGFPHASPPPPSPDFSARLQTRLRLKSDCQHFRAGSIYSLIVLIKLLW